MGDSFNITGVTGEVLRFAVVSQGGPLVMGRSDAGDVYWWDGLVAETRISSICRYTEDFVPPHSFESDDQTGALWFFDDGGGDRATDASGHGHDGTISNGGWVHSIQPVYLDAMTDCLDLSTGGFLGGHSPWGVHVLPAFQYSMRVSGQVSLRPGDPAENFVFHSAGTSEATILVASDHDGAFPIDVGDGLDFGMFFVDSDVSDNTGALRVEIESESLVDAPNAAALHLTRPAILIRPNPAGGTATLSLASSSYASDDMQFEVFGADGRLVRRLDGRGGATDWDLRDRSGDRVPAGRYLVRATARTGTLSENMVVVR